MTEICTSPIRRIRYISRFAYEEGDRNHNMPSWNPKRGFEDLVMNFLRNKAEFEITTAFFDASVDERGNDIEPLIAKVRDLCDDNCTGFWTYHHTYRRNRVLNITTADSETLDTGKGRFVIHFEHEADLLMFLEKFQN